MTSVFADTSYWVALLSPRDEYHKKALEVITQLDDPILFVTTEMVLVEFLNLLATRNSGQLKRNAAEFVQKIRENRDITIVSQTSDQFGSALKVYTEYRDKMWGLTDCASFLTMKDHGLHKALTADDHFRQMGFEAMLR